MSDCCNSTSQKSKKHQCPESDNLCGSVPISTILNHLNKPWEFKLKEQNYFFCDESGCNVVYFGEDNSVIYI